MRCYVLTELGQAEMDLAARIIRHLRSGVNIGALLVIEHLSHRFNRRIGIMLTPAGEHCNLVLMIFEEFVRHTTPATPVRELLVEGFVKARVQVTLYQGEFEVLGSLFEAVPASFSQGHKAFPERQPT